MRQAFLLKQKQRTYGRWTRLRILCKIQELSSYVAIWVARCPWISTGVARPARHQCTVLSGFFAYRASISSSVLTVFVEAWILAYGTYFAVHRENKERPALW